jgi:micrococcal nuclease
LASPCLMACLFWFAAFTLPGALAAPAGNRLQGPVQAIVERVIDGDTLVVRAHIWLDQEVRVHVRLARIDTPELSAQCSRERELAAGARDYMQSMLFGGGQVAPSIWLSEIGLDKYGGRVLARVTGAEGQDIAQSLVKAGYAAPYDGKKRANWCRVARL